MPPIPSDPPLRRLQRGLAVAVAIGTVATGVAYAWSRSYPFGSFTWGAVAVGVGAYTGLVWVALLVLCGVTRRLDPILAVPVLLLVALVTLADAGGRTAPLRVRFALSQRDFEQAIIDRGEVPPGAPCPSHAGSYRIIRCQTVGSVTTFALQRSVIAGQVGFAYLPEGEPRTTAGRPQLTAYEPLTGPWYAYADGS